MYKATTSLHSALLFGLIATFMCAPSFAKHDNEYTSQNGHAIVQDVEKPGTRIEFDEDQELFKNLGFVGKSAHKGPLVAPTEQSGQVVITKVKGDAHVQEQQYA